MRTEGLNPKEGPAGMAASVITMLERQRQDRRGKLAGYDWSDPCALGSFVRGSASVNEWRVIKT